MKNFDKMMLWLKRTVKCALLGAAAGFLLGLIIVGYHAIDNQGKMEVIDAHYNHKIVSDSAENISLATQNGFEIHEVPLYAFETLMAAGAGLGIGCMIFPGVITAWFLLLHMLSQIALAVRE